MTDPAAFGGPGWSVRSSPLREELGTVWGRCGVDSEWTGLRAVLLHRPGEEVEAVRDPGAALMLERPDPQVMREQHDAVADAFRREGVRVHHVDPDAPVPPNQLFSADLFFMTPSGAILGRPASPVRAGEERWVARRLADLGIPILRSVSGTGTFEGADAAWLTPRRVLIGRGLRTNAEGARQVSATLREHDVDALSVDLPPGCMHLMGELRIVDRDLALVREGRISRRALHALEGSGFEVHDVPGEAGAGLTMAHNFVVLGPRRVLMPMGSPEARRLLEALGIECVMVDVAEICKAAGAIGCLTGILEREPADGGRHGPGNAPHPPEISLR